MVRFAVTLPLPAPHDREPFASQLAMAQIHPSLAPLTQAGNGYELDAVSTRGWFVLPEGRGMAGYGLGRALRLLLDVLAGLSALHDTTAHNGQPFVHGEVVPALVRVDRLGAARLIPLAPWHWLAPGALASAERVGHLAPERLLGDAIDQRADVFSAGTWLWEALAGRRLFDSDSVDEIITRLMGGRVALPTLPPELAWAIPLKAVAMCALSVDPAQRFASVADLAAAIEAVAAEHLATHAEVAAYLGARDPHSRSAVVERAVNVPSHLSSLSALVSPVSPDEAVEPPSQPTSSAPRSRSNGRLWVGAAALSLVLALGAGIAARRSAGQEHAGAAAAAAPLKAERSPAAPTEPNLPSLLPVVVPTTEALPSASNPAASATEASRSRANPPKASKPPKAPTPKLKVEAGSLPSRDKSAEKYGI